MNMVQILSSVIWNFGNKFFKLPCNHFQPTPVVTQLHLRNFICIDGKIFRICFFYFGRKIDPELKTVHTGIIGLRIRIHRFIMNDAVASFHPLNATRKNFSMMATAIKVFAFTMKNISQCCNTTVWMCACSLFHLWPIR